MQEMDLPRRYRTILIPLGSFILIGQQQEAMEALRRFYAHLEDGGQLVFSMPTPNSEVYLPATEDPVVWSDPSTVTRPSDGATITIRERRWQDRLEQTAHGVQRYELHDKDGNLLYTEDHEIVSRWYGKYEMFLMLEKAGFRNTRVYGNHTDEEATADSWSRIYWAEK
jgi:hypothetical protein